MSRLDGVIVIKDEETRSHLKSAAHAAGSYLRLYSTGSLDQALVLLKVRSKFDVIFLSNRFEEPYIERFLIEAKRTNGGCNACVVLVGEQSPDPTQELSESIKGRILGHVGRECVSDDLVAIADKVRNLRSELASSSHSSGSHSSSLRAGRSTANVAMRKDVAKDKVVASDADISPLTAQESKPILTLRTTKIEADNLTLNSHSSRRTSNGVAPISRNWDSESSEPPSED